MLTPDSSQSSKGIRRSLGVALTKSTHDDFPLSQRLCIWGRLAHEEYETRGHITALEMAIQCRRLAWEMSDGCELKKPDELAASLQARYECRGERQDLEEIIFLQQRANALTPDESPGKPERLSNLATSLRSRFEREGRFKDIEETIKLEDRAVALVSSDTHRGHADRPMLLSNLGMSLLKRFECSGIPDDLDKAISLQDRAVALTPDGDPCLPSQLMNLGISLRSRFEYLGNMDDLQKSVALHLLSVNLTSDCQPYKLGCLTDAGRSLQMRFERVGDINDLSLAIQFHSCAVNLTYDSHIDKPKMLNGLASSLQALFRKVGDVQKLEQAITHQTRAMALTPDNHLLKPAYCNNFGVMLQMRFETSWNPEDLNEAIAHQTKAVACALERHPNKQQWLYNLSNSLRQRFGLIGNPTDLEEAIRCSTLSVKLVPYHHSQRAHRLLLLGFLFLTRLRSSHAHADDAARGREAFLEAMHHPNSYPLERLRASYQYTVLLTEFCHLFTPPPPPSCILDAYEHALNLIPQCIWLGNDVRNRYTSTELREIRRIVKNAVHAATMAGEYGLALEWLEAGRAVVWSQLLQLQAPIDELRYRYPHIAIDLHRISRALQCTGVTAPVHVLPAATRSEPSFDTYSQGSSHSYALEYKKLIERIRKLEGFKDFMLPKKLSQLVTACAAGPVVVINVHEQSCDALVLCCAGDVVHVPLTEFSLSHARSLHVSLRHYLASQHLLNRDYDPDNIMAGEAEAEFRGVKPRRGLNTTNLKSRHIRSILADLWNLVVKPIMDVVFTLVPHDGTLPHITWCPTGPLAFLPLHAAGIYPEKNDTTSPQTIMDIAVSSYTPTLEALLKPRTKATADGECPKTLIVSQCNTPGYGPISGVTTEAAIVTSLLDISATTTLHDEEGAISTVLESMPMHNWVHFACHGMQDHKNPLKSSIILYDGRLTIEMLMSKKFPYADLAVLSACQTATGDDILSDEAIHLTAAMLNVGFKSVVGTMWSIYDSSTPMLMGEFYRRMIAQVKAGGELHPAYALHEATKVLRAKYGVDDFVRSSYMIPDRTSQAGPPGSRTPDIHTWFTFMTGGHVPAFASYGRPGRDHANPQPFPTDMHLITMHLQSRYVPAWVWDRLAETASVKSLRSVRATLGRPEDAWGLAKTLTATSNNLVDLRLDLTSAEYMLFFPENPDFEELGRLIPIGKLQALERLEIINPTTEISALNVARFIALVDTPTCRHFALKLVNNHPSATQDFFTASWSILDGFLAGHPTIEVVDISWEDDTGHEAVAEAMIREYFSRLESSGKLRPRR